MNWVAVLMGAVGVVLVVMAIRGTYAQFSSDLATALHVNSAGQITTTQDTANKPTATGTGG